MSDEYDEDAPRPRRRKPIEPDQDPARSPRSRRSVRLDNDDEPVKAPAQKATRKTVPSTAKGQKPTKQPQQPVDRGRWRNATLHERITRIRWIAGMVYRYLPVILVLAILLAFFGPRMLLMLRTGLNPPLIATFYTPSVQHWKQDISRWSTQYDVNPNLIATLMQIESCGYPGATSVVGAQGLFQVMPMNFSENTVSMTDPETNAEAGIGVIRDCLRYADGDVGLAMACYNGGPGLISSPQQYWPTESQRYYTWGTGIYNDAVSGRDKSETLDNWLQSGGVYLCQKAEATLGIATAQYTPAQPTTFVPPPPTLNLATGGPTIELRPTGTPLTAVPTIHIEIPPTRTP